MARATVWICLLALGACTTAGGDGELAPPAMTETPGAHPAPVAPAEPLAGRMAPAPVGTEPPPPPVFELVIPTDQRTPVLAASPPPPLSGGTLLVTRDEQHVIASDPDRDRISIVSLADAPSAPSLTATIALEPGDRPGRLAEDGQGRVHAVLRGGGAVLSFDASGALLARRAVCSEPRGIGYDAPAQALLVACASGDLVQLPASPEGAPERLARLAPDLRDVVTGGERAYVSRFKRAELLALDGAQASEGARPAPLRTTFPQSQGGQIFDTLAPTQAWRTLRAADGIVFMLHQGSREGTIDLTPPPVSSGNAGGSPYGGGGGGASCSGVVQSELTLFETEGTPALTVRLSGQLPLDAAFSSDGTQLAVLFAGTADPNQPRRSVRVVSDGSGGAGAVDPHVGKGPLVPAFPHGPVQVYARSEIPGARDACLQADAIVDVSKLREPIAIAAVGNGWVVQDREPAQLLIVLPGQNVAPIALEGASVEDTGHALFHRDSGGGISCVSCHGEGGEDGHVWNFLGFGPRRTQALHVGLEGTAPLHWAGDMPGVAALMDEVLVTRMGGVHQSPERVAALERWLFALRAPAPLRSAGDPAAVRGRELFEGAAACAGCHRGDKLTDNATVDVGTGEALQVPSLVGVAYRGPWLHSGGANTLRERFDPACGGAEHGHTAELDAAQLDDLVAYLESL